MKFSALLKYEFLKLYKQDQLPQNFLATIDPKKLINLYESIADIGMGRQIIGFYQKK